MSSMPLSEIQELNLANLWLLRDTARRDMAEACCTFGLKVEQLKRLCALSPADLTRIALSMGNECLFAPRADLASLLEVPAAAMPVVASARERF